MGIFLSNIPEYVQTELFKRMDVEERNPGIYAKTVWTRAKCWAVKKSTNTDAPVLMGGTLNPDGSLKGGFEEIYTPRSDSNIAGSSLKPMAGITNVSISTFGSLGSTRKAQLQFIVYGMENLDLFLSTYMSLGSTVSIEYGWSHHENYGSAYEAISSDIVGSFKDMQARIEQGGGNYDGFVGLVSNYNFKAMPDGGFDCGIDLIGHGQAILASQVSDELPKITIENPAEDDDAEISFGKIGAVNFKTAINNLKNDVAEYISDGEQDGIFKHDLYVEEGGTTEKKINWFVSWGWMEDNLLSKYFGYVTEGKDGEQIIFDIRSLDKVDDEFESVKITSHPALMNRKFGSNPRIAFLGSNFEVDGRTGNLREIFINVTVLKDAFANAESLQSGLDGLFNAVNANFAGVWDFKVVADEHVLTRSKIIDSNWSVAKPEELLANEKRSSVDNPTGLFYFPAYDKKSIVRTINLEGKMPSAAAMTVLYGRNQPEIEDSGADKAAVGSSDDANTGKSEGIDADDLVMNKMRTPRDFGNPNYYDANTELREGAMPDTAESIYANDGEIVGSQELALSRLIDSESQNETVADAEEDDIEQTDEQKEADKQQKLFYTNYPEKKPLDKAETNQFRIDVRKSEEGVENTVPFLIPITLSLTLDGIGGLIWGNAFHCEYLPDLYKRRGIFQVTAVDHSITTNGWETTIKGQMRSVSITALKDVFQ